MTPPPPPPPSPTYGWPSPTPAPRSGATLLGIARWVWVAAWLPLLPAALFMVWMPAFVAPLVDTRLPLLCFLLLPLVNLGVGRASRSSTAPAIAVALTTVAGCVFLILGPLIVLIAVNLGTR